MSENRFRLKYDQLRDGNPAGKDDDTTKAETAQQEDKKYLHSGHNRHLAVMWPDGKLESFNYAYLVSIKYDPITEPNIITLHFTSDVVTIKGYSLMPLVWDVFNGMSRIIECIDPRYQETQDDKTPSITAITIERAG